MLSADSLTTTDTSSFWGYWDSIKSYIPSLRALPSRITSLMTKSTTLKLRTKAVGAPDLTAQLSESGVSLASLLNLAIDVKNKIDTYLPDWLASSKQTSTGVGAFWIPVTLGIGGLAALSYVAYNGLQLLKDYQTEERIIQGVEQKLLTLEQAQKLIKSTVPETRITLSTDTIFGSMGSTLVKPLAWVLAGFIGIQLIAPALLSGITKRWK